VSKSNNLTASMEDYLEAIFNIVQEKYAARSRDIAAYLQVRSSSVTEALRNLSAHKLIHYAPYEVITLTPKGRVIAEEIVRRHRVLREFFVKVLDVEDEEADRTACEMEHIISQDVPARITRFCEYIDDNPLRSKPWLEEATGEPGGVSRKDDDLLKETA
jgi:DtxR family Mn-dependent transcriptional regulator